MELFEYINALSSNVWLYGGSFILILSILVFVHEWGHYIVARLCNVRVETFSIGFGKELFGLDDKSGTRWKFSLIPLGGYVELFGHANPAEEQMYDKKGKAKKAPKPKKLSKKELEVAFFAKPVWQRALVVFAGPAVNYIFAIILFAGLFTFHGEPVTPPTAGAIIEGSAAHKSGFEPHDVVVTIDGKEIESFEQIRREMMISLDTRRHFEIERNGRMIDVYAIPEKVEVKDRFGFSHSKGLLGILGPRSAIRAQDVIAIDNKSYVDKDIKDVVAALKKKMGKDFVLKTKAGESESIYHIKPLAEFNENLADEESQEYGILFISDRESKIFVQYELGEALLEAIYEVKDVTLGTLTALGQMISGTRSATELGGIIRIGALAGDMAQQGIIAVIMFTALLSVNLGFINLLPIPLLDGGHLVFYAVEAVIGKPIPDKFQEYAFQAGLFFLITIMAFANINDIIQLIL